MKRIYLSLFILILSITGLSQNKFNSPVQKHKYAEFVYVTQEKDTLYLSSEDSLSRNIYLSWCIDPDWEGSDPVIVFISQNFIDSRKSRHYPELEDTLMIRKAKKKRKS